MKKTANRKRIFLSICLTWMLIGSSLFALIGIPINGVFSIGGSTAPSHTFSSQDSTDAATIYVDDDNWADPMQDGSEEHPCDTINEALNDTGGCLNANRSIRNDNLWC